MTAIVAQATRPMVDLQYFLELYPKPPPDAFGNLLT
jgi:hypothetical protein